MTKIILFYKKNKINKMNYKLTPGYFNPIIRNKLYFNI